MLETLKKIRQNLLSQTIVAASKVNIVKDNFGTKERYASQKEKDTKAIQKEVNAKTKKYKIKM